MPKKIGAGDRPQEYDSRTGRYGISTKPSQKAQIERIRRVWDEDYGPIQPVDRLTKTEYRLYCQTVDNNQFGSIEIINKNRRRVKIYPDDGSVIVIEDNNNNARLRLLSVRKFRTVDEMSDYYKTQEGNDD